jgi:hypothetical protein
MNSQLSTVFHRLADVPPSQTFDVFGANVEFLSRSDEPAIDLIVTTARLGRFFAEIGRPVSDAPQPPTPEEIANFVAVAAKYGYVLGTPEANAAVGITMPQFAG